MGELSTQSAANQVKSGSGTARPWATLTTQNACPAESTQLYTYLRIPQAGVPEEDWTQIPLGAPTRDKDAAGRYYTTVTSQADRLGKPELVTWLLAQPGNTGTVPFLAVCRDAMANPTGYFKTDITFTGTTSTTLSWSIVSPDYSAGPVAAATTTSLVATPSGKDLVLAATVTPAGVAGTVTFKDGSTVLGTSPVSGGTASLTLTAPAQGAHTYTAELTPTDTGAYQASTGTAAVTLGLDSATGQLVLAVPAAPVVDGALTFSVPFGTPVALAGARSADNSRVTASGAFPTVTVTDTRRDGLLTGWEVNAQATDFVGTGSTVSAKYLGWVPSTSATPEAGSPLQTQNGAAVASFLDETSSAGLSSSATLGRTATPGRGSATLGAALKLAVPGATAEGSYTSTVTVTLVSN
ncbi:Ig-like domain repeat protein [Cellulomonas soli]